MASPGYGSPYQCCYLCGRLATGMVNVTAGAASSVPSVMKSVCEQHGGGPPFPQSTSPPKKRDD